MTNTEQLIRQQSLDLLQKYYEAFNTRDWTLFFSLLDENVIHDLNQGERQVGIAAFKDFISEMNRCYSEQVLGLQLMVNDNGTRLAAEFFIEGTYLQSQAGLPPANKQKYHLPVGAFFDIQHNKITRVTNYYNLQEWVAQVSSKSITEA